MHNIFRSSFNVGVTAVGGLALLLTCGLLSTQALAQAASQPGPGGAPPGHGAGGGGPQAAQMQEMMQMQMRIMAARDKVMADPAIAKERDALQAAVEKAMAAGDKTITEKIARFKVLQAEFETLKKNPTANKARGQELVGELTTLGQALAAAEQRAMADQKIKAKVAAFQKKVDKKLAEVDPEVPAMMKKFEAMMPPGRGPGAGGPRR